MKRILTFGLITLTLIFIAYEVTQAQSGEEEPDYDWRADWGIEEGFAIDVDTTGYNLPTAIAFVPEPGPDPKDPLYFVTELRGQVKAVTNDRTVYTFVEDFFHLTPGEEFPSDRADESGLAGICLEPERGYVFVTFAYHDASGTLRNNIMRFETTPRTFAGPPKSRLAFTEVFSAFETRTSHQIGPCQIKDGLLYVSVGDGKKSTESQKLGSALGKILRMTLDGEPVPDNPFYQDDDRTKPQNYVWAYGFRNPFGLKSLGDHLFVAENGFAVDRFLEVSKGENYLWDGTDWSMGTKAKAVFHPGFAPVQLDYYPSGGLQFPEPFQGAFFIAASGNLIWATNPDDRKIPGVVMLRYNLREDRLLAPPKYFLKYRGDAPQIVTGLAFGPDGLYVVPLLSDGNGETNIYKITYDPSRAHPFGLVQNDNPRLLMRDKGCFGCHRLGDYGATAAPSLDRDAMVARIQARLHSTEYLQSLDALDRMETEPYRSYREERHEVVATDGIEKVRLWMKYHIMEPQFDNPYSGMPNLGISEPEAEMITDYLLAREDETATGITATARRLLNRILPARAGRKHLLLFFVGGVVVGFSLWLPSRKFRSRVNWRSF